MSLPKDSMTDADYQRSLNAPQSGPFWKHNKYVAYYHLHASQDTVFKYVYEAIQYDPVGECFSFQHGPYPVSPMLSKEYGPKKVKGVCRLCDSIERGLDSTMIRALIVIKHNDQKYRASADDAPEIKGNEGKWKEQNTLDSVNQVLVAKMMDKKQRYIGKDIVGFELRDVAFDVIQHAGLAYQEKYLPLVEQAIKDRNLDRSCYPLLIDRINMRKGIPQIFGTQLVWNKKREINELYTVKSMAKVNELRKDYDLGPLDKYLKNNHAVIPDKAK